MVIPRLYVILDANLLLEPAEEFAVKLSAVGVRMLQYRNKNSSAKEMLESARNLAAIARERQVSFFVNDRPDVAYLAGASGVHLGQEDLGVESARAVMGPAQWVGVSTHNQEQFEEALLTSADYIAVGPIFATTSKVNPDAVVGTELLRCLRLLTPRPIVAIGGITLENATAVIESGADSVAVISDILLAANPIQRVKQYLQRLEAVKPTATD
jgi:thiamine-phosphate pyrophosphorylase